MATKATGGNSKKKGRSKRKREGKLNPLSRFVRDVISAEEYFRLTKSK